MGKVISDLTKLMEVVMFIGSDQPECVASCDATTESTQRRITSINETLHFLVVEHEGEKDFFELLL